MGDKSAADLGSYNFFIIIVIPLLEVNSDLWISQLPIRNVLYYLFYSLKDCSFNTVGSLMVYTAYDLGVEWL